MVGFEVTPEGGVEAAGAEAGDGRVVHYSRHQGAQPLIVAPI